MSEIGLGEMCGAGGVEDVRFDFRRRLLVWWWRDEFFDIVEVHFPFVEGFAQDGERQGARFRVRVAGE